MTTAAQFKDSLRRMYLQDRSLNRLKLSEILGPVPRIDKLNLREGERVLMRCDLDVPLKNGTVADDSRLKAILPSVRYALDQDWIPILFGHLGRDPENSLKPVAEHLGKMLKREIIFVPDWLDENNNTVTDSLKQKLSKLAPGQPMMLGNTRKYQVERVMWKLIPSKFWERIGSLHVLASEIYKHVSKTVINEALAASNFDFSSSVLPLVMDNVSYGFYVAEEFSEHMLGARRSSLVIFSGIKIDKLNDLEEIIKRGRLKMIISAGSLAMAFKKAHAELSGEQFYLGLAEEDRNAKFFISHKRIEQAKAMLTECDKQSIEVLLPIDFVLDNGEISKTIPSGHSQFDIGPLTREMFANKLEKFARTTEGATLFYNGVFGKFEDERFSEGTRSFIASLKQATENGVKTYVGGGEGRMALLKYGQLEDVTHAFTAGGTILKSLGHRHLAFVKANYLSATRNVR